MPADPVAADPLAAGPDPHPDLEETLESDRLVDQALDCMASGDSAAAIPYLQRAIALAPAHPAAAHALMRAFEETGRLPEALTLAQASIAAEPDDVLTHTRLSIILQRLGRVPEAEAAAARAKILGWKYQLRNPATPSL